jgi:hypothetical protein
MKYFLAIVFSVFLSISAHAKSANGIAEERFIAAPNQCMKENISININYNLKGKSFDEIKKKFDEQNAKIEEYAKEQKLTKFTLQSKNYNISASASSYNRGGEPEDFQFSGNGNVSYMLDNAEAAFKFSDFLITQKIQVSLNSNMYNQGNCEK